MNQWINYCGIIIVCGGLMFVDYMGYHNPWIYERIIVLNCNAINQFPAGLCLHKPKKPVNNEVWILRFTNKNIFTCTVIYWFLSYLISVIIHELRNIATCIITKLYIFQFDHSSVHVIKYRNCQYGIVGNQFSSSNLVPRMT